MGGWVEGVVGRAGNSGGVGVGDEAQDQNRHQLNRQPNRHPFHQQFVTNNERLLVEYDNCKVLVTDQKIESVRDIIPILEQVGVYLWEGGGLHRGGRGLGSLIGPLAGCKRELIVHPCHPSPPSTP